MSWFKKPAPGPTPEHLAQEKEKTEQYIQTYLDDAKALLEKKFPGDSLEPFEPLTECSKCGADEFTVEYSKMTFDPAYQYAVVADKAQDIIDRINQEYPEVIVKLGRNYIDIDSFAVKWYITLSLTPRSYETLKTTCVTCQYSFLRKPKDAE